MPDISPTFLISLCRQASALDFGLLIQTDNVDSLRPAIYSALRSANIPLEDLDIQISVPSTPNTLYLLRRSVELPE